MSNTWNSVPLLQEGRTTFTAGSINPSISALVARTDALKSRMDGLDGVAAVGMSYSDIGFVDADITVGMLLAYDENTGKYVKASAEWDQNTINNSGSLVPKQSGHVVGVAVSEVDSVYGTASILCYGWINDPVIVSAMAKDGVGDYYLTSEGRASKTPPTNLPRIYCFTKTASGKILVKPQAPEYGGHTHNNYDLPNNWITNLTVADVPDAIAAAVSASGKASKLSIINDQNLVSIASGNTNHIVLIKNGEFVHGDRWCIDGGFIYVAMTIVPTDVLTISAIYPLTGTNPIVRSINTNGGLFSIVNRGGDVYIDVADQSTVHTTSTGTAIAAIDNTGINYVDVVNKLYPGLGITIGAYKDSEGVIVPGCYVIHSSSVLKNQIDMTVTNLNGVIFGTDASTVGYIYPANNTASISGTVRVPHYEGDNVRCRLNVMVKGNGSTVSGFTANIINNIFPVDDQGSDTLTNIVNLSALTDTYVSKVYKISTELPTGCVRSDSLISITMESNQSAATTVLAVSIELFTPTDES